MIINESKKYNVTEDIDQEEIKSEDELVEGTEKKANGKWVNKGKDGEHGEFDTKSEADAQRKAMFASGWKG